MRVDGEAARAGGARPALPMRRASSRSAARRAQARRPAPRRRRPARGSRSRRRATSSGLPPPELQTTGRPQAMYSMMALEQPSRCWASSRHEHADVGLAHEGQDLEAGVGELDDAARARGRRPAATRRGRSGPSPSSRKRQAPGCSARRDPRRGDERGEILVGDHAAGHHDRDGRAGPRRRRRASRRRRLAAGAPARAGSKALYTTRPLAAPTPQARSPAWLLATISLRRGHGRAQRQRAPAPGDAVADRAVDDRDAERRADRQRRPATTSSPRSARRRAASSRSRRQRSAAGRTSRRAGAGAHVDALPVLRR